jgi:hypothetical protein
MNEREQYWMKCGGWTSEIGGTLPDWFDVAWALSLELYKVIAIPQLQILFTFLRCHILATSA